MIAFKQCVHRVRLQATHRNFPRLCFTVKWDKTFERKPKEEAGDTGRAVQHRAPATRNRRKGRALCKRKLPRIRLRPDSCGTIGMTPDNVTFKRTVLSRCDGNKKCRSVADIRARGPRTSVHKWKLVESCADVKKQVNSQK